MSILDSLKSRLPGVAVSPQGWTDDVEGWPVHQGPDPRAALRQGLEKPGDAVDKIIDALEGLSLEREKRFEKTVASLQMATIGRCLQALRMHPGELPTRKGTFGRLVRAFVGYLPQHPWLLQKNVIRIALEHLEQDLVQSKDEGLGRAAARLDEARKEAAITLGFLLQPELDLSEAGEEPAAAPPAEPAAAAPSPAAAPEGPASPAGPAPAAGPGKISLPSQSSPDLTADLTQEKIYRCLLEECMKDGKLSAGEEDSILAVRRQLGIPVHRHAAIVREVQHAYRDGRLQGEDELDLAMFFEKIYSLALEDGVITKDERRLLRSVADLLGITEAEIASVEARVGRPPG